MCTDAAGNAEPDEDCANADPDYEGATYVAGRPYMWRYWPASNLVIVPYGQPMGAGGSVRRPLAVASTGGVGGSVAGGTRPARIATPSAGQSGGTLAKSGSSSSISRGGLGVKGGSSTGGKGSAGSSGS